MKLRTRLVVGVLATAVPLSVVLAFVQTRIERARVLDRVAAVARARMSGGMRERCEAFPEVFPGRRRHERVVPLDDVLGLLDEAPDEAPLEADAMEPDAPARVFAYDDAFRSWNERAPELPRALVVALSSGEDTATIVERHEGAFIERSLVRMPWRTGPCAILLVEHLAPPRRMIARVLVPLFVALAVIVALLVVAGPVVRRITRLTRALDEGRAKEIEDQTSDEIGALSRAFVSREARIAEQMEALSGRERALKEYIANTTHDVLAPVAVLKTQLAEIETLARAGQGVPNALALSALEETHYLAGLVHNLNAQARIDARLERDDPPVDLSAVVERAVSRHAPLASRRGIAIDLAVPDAPVLVRGDVTLLEQALSNLVGNAIRYNREGGHVAVVLEVADALFTLRVLDDGDGVTKEALARLGERGFRTTEARTRRPEGMGLGLHIVREVAATHGLRLDFAQNEPSGLVVTLEGPIAELVP